MALDGAHGEHLFPFLFQRERLERFPPARSKGAACREEKVGERGAGAGEEFASTRSDLTATRDRAKRAHLWTASSGWLERIWTFGGTSRRQTVVIRIHGAQRGIHLDPRCAAPARLYLYQVSNTRRQVDFSRPTDMLDHNVARWGVDLGASLARGVGVGADASMPRVDVRFGGTPTPVARVRRRRRVTRERAPSRSRPTRTDQGRR